MAARELTRALGLLALGLAGPAIAGDARVLDASGRVLTVGNWDLVTLDGGLQLRVADDRVLGWELRDEDGTLLTQGVVPGTSDPGRDASPSVSRNPATGELWLAWSHQEGTSARVIALLRFGQAGWAADSYQVLASDAADQLDPFLVHDESGAGWLAWIDGADTRTVRFLGLTSDGRVMGRDVLSEGISDRNGAPSLGIDALGRLFVAYAGADAATGDVRLFVLAPGPIGGGVTHVPDPIIELGVRASLPTPTIGEVADPDQPAPVPDRVQLTVLGGTPVAWWTERDGAELVRFRYVAETGTGWTESAVRTIDLRSGTVASVPEALALVEARLRRVIQQRPGGVIGVPGTPGGLVLGRTTRR